MKINKTRLYVALALPVFIVIWLTLPNELFIVSLAKAFLLQLLIALPILTLILFALKWKGMAIGCVVSLLILSLFMYPFLKRDRLEISRSETITVAQFNLKRTNQSYYQVVEMIKLSGAQLVSIQEIDRQWMDRLKDGLSENYPWSFGLPDESGFYGVAVFSKHPAVFQKSEMVGLENVEGVCHLPSGDVHFLSSHLHTPTTPLNFELRNRHLKMIANWAKEKRTPVITLGDYNAVSWDSNLACLENDGRLSRASGGWIPTFPANVFPLIPIDQIYFSDEFACASMWGQTIPGSDHRGVVARLAITGRRTHSAERAR
jgi:endonuclease/exonuclease/phosphatase (EEP) superfamily protein YafD